MHLRSTWLTALLNLSVGAIFVIFAERRESSWFFIVGPVGCPSKRIFTGGPTPYGCKKLLRGSMSLILSLSIWLRSDAPKVCTNYSPSSFVSIKCLKCLKCPMSWITTHRDYTLLVSVKIHSPDYIIAVGLISTPPKAFQPVITMFKLRLMSVNICKLKQICLISHNLE